MIDETKKTDSFHDGEQTQQQTVPEAHQAAEINYKELFLRTSADLQNFQRRVERERQEWALLMQAEILQKLVPFFDEFDRAVETAEKNITPGSAVWLEGFALMSKNLHKAMADVGIQEVDTTGAFNPEFHDALMNVESPSHKSGDIVQVLSKGYMFKGKVLTHARVSVAK